MPRHALIHIHLLRALHHLLFLGDIILLTGFRSISIYTEELFSITGYTMHRQREIWPDTRDKFNVKGDFTMTRYEHKAIEEIRKVERKASCYIIMRNGDVEGKIVATHNKYHMVSHVSLHMFGLGDSGLADTETVKGMGFNREDWGIAEILARNSDFFIRQFGFKPDSVRFDNAYNYWRQTFNSAGLTVIQAL